MCDSCQFLIVILALSGMDVPLVGQLRIIHQGRFLEDNKALSEHKVTDGEQTAMHLIIKSEVSKPAGEKALSKSGPALGLHLHCLPSI